MVRNGHNVSICIWYEMVVMYRSAYGTKWLWYENDFHYGTKWLWYEMTVIPLKQLGPHFFLRQLGPILMAIYPVPLNAN